MIDAIGASALAVHVAAGFAALAVGPFAMFSRKGGLVHRRAGTAYVWAMVVVAATAVGLAIRNPDTFLLAIAVLSFFLTFTGFRALRGRRAGGHAGATPLDWLVSLLTLAFGAYLIASGLLPSEPVDPVALGFGALTAWLAWANLRRLSKPNPSSARLANHIIGMGSAYIATFTAFAVTNVTFMPSAFAWAIPSVVGTLAIRRAVARHTRGRPPDDPDAHAAPARAKEG